MYQNASSSRRFHFSLANFRKRSNQILRKITLAYIADADNGNEFISFFDGSYDFFCMRDCLRLTNAALKTSCIFICYNGDYFFTFDGTEFVPMCSIPDTKRSI